MPPTVAQGARLNGVRERGGALHLRRDYEEVRLVKQACSKVLQSPNVDGVYIVSLCDGSAGDGRILLALSGIIQVLPEHRHRIQSALPHFPR